VHEILLGMTIASNQNRTWTFENISLRKHTMATQKKSGDLNRDPITGTPGAHPVATGVGTAVGGAAAGLAAGAAAGPIGAAVGAVIGGVAGGLAGSAVGEEIDPTVEEAYWRDNYSNRPYYSDDLAYDDISPAYRHGWESRSRYANSNFDDVETSLKQSWEETEHDSRVGWEKARLAARDAWDHASSRKPR
jgi:hypothetical protein